ncbi:phenylalanine--tRNA ligase subunit beta [Tersicoccus phoenicis]|uniref:Phenylalanine--tRNA ligase beta subunit n=1 Tax=Tersicoccus phoenicis TaxID=554083 RepID=A0A1R1L620_9MICC|nr:phenylalanine--tRNA ligase subunit beta [Tersicoccus phoenicis]OMH22986.1 phenylalanine--tRNA ligase subunit beta [Tersicoccus phoenicis]
MRIPLSWLREYADVPAGATAEDVMADLVTVGLEEEDVHRPSDDLHGPVVVGQVLSAQKEPQTNGKTINWCQVRVAPEGQRATDGGDDVRGIVCGAHNFVPGDKVVVTLPGAVLPGDFRIAARKTYGHVSDGMIASVRELGIGEDHDGILVLSSLGLDPEVGENALALLGVTDEAAEINVTPDRGYCFSIRGVAREYAHATGTGFTDPATLPVPPTRVGGGVGVHLADDAPIHGAPGARRFLTRRVTGIDPTRPTPPWLASRLRLCGVRSISLPVDIANYVMFELGQPIHTYDADAVTGDITVRRARTGETLRTLDDKERTLDPEDLLITDESGPIGLAGVMGGASTECSGATVNVLVEAACFDPVSIARTRRRHKLPSEAAKRFERGVDPEVAAAAAQRVVDLLVDLAGGTDTSELTDERIPVEATEIFLPRGFVDRLIGRTYDDAVVTGRLTELGAIVTDDDAHGVAGWRVLPPTWRPDLTIPADLAEEVARLDGYENIPSRLPVAPPGRGFTRVQQQRRRLATSLAAAGLTEVLSYPFVTERANATFGVPVAGEHREAVKLANPISAEQAWLRTSMLPGLLDTARRNVSRGFRDLALFETGTVFLPEGRHGSASVPPIGALPEPTVLAELDAGLPAQPAHLGVVLTGHEPGTGRNARVRDWADALDAALLAAQVLGVQLTVATGRHQAFHPGRTAALSLPDGTPVGWAGELHPQLLAASDLPARTAAAEVDLDALYAAAPATITAAPISTYPMATQDVALVVDEAVTADQLREALTEGAGDLLESIDLFDVYTGEALGQGKKSLAFTLRFRAPDRTLTADEASAARSGAVAVAVERHGAAQR